MAVQQVACVAGPDTILAWYRRLIAHKFDGSKQRRDAGRPRTTPEIEELVVRLARENSGWGYDRILGALGNLGHRVSDQTVGNILRRHGTAPAPKRSRTTTWTDFIHRHRAVLAGTDFFTVEVLTWRGLVTWYVLFFLHLDSRKVTIGGITEHPDAEWMQQMARNATLGPLGASEWMPVRFARPGHEVLSIVPGDVGSGRSKMPAVASAESEPERICRDGYAR
jgi:putative transposase